MAYAHRTNQISPEAVNQVLRCALQLETEGRESLHFEIGGPDYETSSHISVAGIRAITHGRTRYTPPAGMPSIR